MKEKYDYLLVGAGLFNAIFAREATKNGKKCIVIEKRSHVGGNIYCEEIEGINVHRYGPHIFHTNSKDTWAYVNELCMFNNFIYSPLASYKDKLYNLPFNMNTFYQLWGTKSPHEAKEIIKKQSEKIPSYTNLEEYALSMVGRDIYKILIKGYTEKQWGKDATELPSFIIKRIPLRFIYDNNYFNDTYQGIPIGGYNQIISTCFKDCEVVLDTDYCNNKSFSKIAKTVIYTGMIDEYYDYCYGELEYRSLCFKDELYDIGNYQGNAAVNYTERDVPYTRIIEHKHFEFGNQLKTIVTKEYPQKWEKGLEPFYPVNTQDNTSKYDKYYQLSIKEKNVIFAGRLGSYKYYNMDQIIEKSRDLYSLLNAKV
jgi:UDP-galactopyranose mutase